MTDGLPFIEFYEMEYDNSSTSTNIARIYRTLRYCYVMQRVIYVCSIDFSQAYSCIPMYENLVHKLVDLILC